MPHCCCDQEEVYIRERLLPRHCETCECRRSELQVTRKMSSIVRSRSCGLGGCGGPRFRKCSCCHYFPPAPCCCPCKGIVDCDLCLCYECRKIRGRSEATIRRRHRGDWESPKHTLLETWFSRFDTDGDGFLELVDLESLLKHLGARNSYAKRVLQACDRDNDGRLSFNEFVHLWQRAAHHHDDFTKVTGCSDLSHIVKKYNLFSDYRHCTCHDYHCKHVTVANRYPVHKVKCKCGQGSKILPFATPEDRVHNPLEVTTAKDTSEDPDKLPLMSMNRDNVV